MIQNHRWGHMPKSARKLARNSGHLASERAVICASHKHTYPWGGWRQSGCRRGYNGSSMNISAGLFTYSFCWYSRIRWRAIGSKRGRSRAPWKPHRARGRGGEKERGGKKKQEPARMLDAPCSPVTVETREICRRENILCHCEEEFQTTRKVRPPRRGSLVEPIR